MNFNAIFDLRRNTRRAFLATAFVIGAAMLPQVSRAADDYTIHVSIVHYDGPVEHDGQHLFKVRVQHGHDNYDVYLAQAMPELSGVHEKVNVLVAHGSDKWLSLSSHDHSSPIHSVNKSHHQ
ncbi:MAG: hypothetical protein ACC661_12575 [Verrucomicrobiales bacterium]